MKCIPFDPLLLALFGGASEKQTNKRNTIFIIHSIIFLIY